MKVERHQVQPPSVHKRAELVALLRILSLIEKRSPIRKTDLIKALTSELDWINFTHEELSPLLIQLAEAGYITIQDEWVSIADPGSRFVETFRSEVRVACQTQPLREFSACYEKIERPKPKSDAGLETRPLAAAIPSLRPKMGWLVENIPRFMRAYVPVEAEVRISPDFSREFRSGLRGGGSLSLRRVSITAAMSVRLVAPGGGFTIAAQSPETQWVDKADENISSWRFTITALRRGSHTLSIMLSYRLVGAMGLIADTALPDQTINITVRTNVARTSMRAAAWTFTLCAGALVGSYGQEVRDYLRELSDWHLSWPGSAQEDALPPKMQDQLRP